LVSSGVLVLCLVLVVHTWGMEAFVVPTGSMAPAFAGHHRAADCPRCGFPVLVGRHTCDPDGTGQDCYDRSACPNCGFTPVPIAQAPEATGDHILVNKNVFYFRRPRRWEIVVFRLFGKVFVKRVIGLPEELLAILDGDIYVDGTLARKSLDEFKTMRILVFDHNYQPPGGWHKRWEHHAPRPADVPSPSDSWYQTGFTESDGDFAEPSETSPSPHLRIARELELDASDSPRQYHWLTYRNFSLDRGKVEPLLDEYAYNGGAPGPSEPVHDFMLECDLRVQGTGKVALGITDGQDVLIAEIPVGRDGHVRLLQPPGMHLPPEELPRRPLATDFRRLQPGRTYHIELAFVDRRLTLAVDGVGVFSPVDLPRPRRRAPVPRPVTLGARGARAVFGNIRLYRDIHYTQAGRNGVHGKAVRLRTDQYFVMGDNSPNSEDSRFWPGDGLVPGRNLLGKPFMIHLPNRVLTQTPFGRCWHCQIPDWSRLRVIR
jgi:signal peptidase I